MFGSIYKGIGRHHKNGLLEWGYLPKGRHKKRLNSELFSPRKTLVKGESFTRSEEKRRDDLIILCVTY